MTRVAIIGGGAAGALQALHLKAAGIQDVTMIERARAPGRGAAYSTQRPEHLLNVPARRMSAFAADEEHFARWHIARNGGGAEDFVPRMMFGDYVVQLLAEAGIETVKGEAVDLDADGVLLADGRRIAADTVVLATGNFRPATPAGIDPASLGPLWIDDPWAAGIDDGLGAGDVVLLLGTGLTAVDAALTLDATGFGGRVVALSRRGLAPRAHTKRPPVEVPPGILPSNCVAMLRRVRARSEEVGWHSAVQELRTVTQGLWHNASEAERRRFLRHLRPWWDVHRHKVAPAVGATIDRMLAAGKLAIGGGRLLSAEADGDRAIVRFRPRGGDAVETLRVARIVNCTGPEGNIARAGEPLLDALLASRRIRPDPLGLGIEVDEDCRAGAGLYAIGPVTRGAFWESVAVPDIRDQAARVAELIAAA